MSKIPPGARALLYSPVFWVTMALLPMVYMALYAVMFLDGFSNDIRAMVLGAVFSGLLNGGIAAFWYGTSAAATIQRNEKPNEKPVDSTEVERRTAEVAQVVDLIAQQRREATAPPTDDKAP